jgi:hypothetical protein
MTLHNGARDPTGVRRGKATTSVLRPRVKSATCAGYVGPAAKTLDGVGGDGAGKGRAANGTGDGVEEYLLVFVLIRG